MQTQPPFPHTLTAEGIYERRWALTVLEQALERLEQEYRRAGNATLFEQLKPLLTDEPGRASQASIALELNLSENALKQALLVELYGEKGVEDMRRMKRALDPEWKLAPGVLFPK